MESKWQPRNAPYIFIKESKLFEFSFHAFITRCLLFMRIDMPAKIVVHIRVSKSESESKTIELSQGQSLQKEGEKSEEPGVRFKQ